MRIRICLVAALFASASCFMPAHAQTPGSGSEFESESEPTMPAVNLAPPINNGSEQASIEPCCGFAQVSTESSTVTYHQERPRVTVSTNKVKTSASGTRACAANLTGVIVDAHPCR